LFDQGKEDSNVTFELSNKWDPPIDYLFVEYIDAVTNEVKCEPFENIGIGWSKHFDAHCLECKLISIVTLYAVGGQYSNDNGSKFPACCGKGGGR
jgi:hypothetical protein